VLFAWKAKEVESARAGRELMTTGV